MANNSVQGRGRRWPKAAEMIEQRKTLMPSSPSEDDSPHDAVYQNLRRMILYSELRPGEWLRQVDLAERFGVSRTPIREAMRSLQQEGLATEGINTEEIERLRAKLEEITALSVGAPLPVYLREEWQLRLQLYHVTQRERLLGRIIYLREHAERYLRLAYSSEGRIAGSLAFHHQLIAAVEARDALNAESINQAALRWTVRHVAPILAPFMQNRQA